MFYRVLREIATVVIKVFFRKIYLNGHEQVPEKGALIIAANHPMAFADACILACFLDRPFHFLVRGDVFIRGWKWFFRWTNQIPIYRFRDGFSNLRKNHLSFIKVQEALADQKAVLIFSEGNTTLAKRLHRVQRGTARLVFGAFEERQVENINVLPVGINYTSGGLFRSEIMIEIGAPIRQKDYLEEYKQSKSVGIKHLTNDLEMGLKPLVVHIDKPEDDRWVSSWLDYQRSLLKRSRFPVLEKHTSLFKSEKKWADKINGLESHVRHRMGELITEWTGQSTKPVNKTSVLWRSVLLVLTAPFALVGWVLNFIPFYTAKWIAEAKVDKIEFQYPVRMGLFLVLGLIYYVLIATVLAMLYWPGILSLFLIPVLGYFSIIWLEDLRSMPYTLH